jgi:membrane protease YdiL (CAAX protease family)
VLITAGLFASAHPSTTFIPEFLVGAVLGGALLLSEGNLLVPALAHSGYNAMVLVVELLLRSGGGGQS